MMMNFGAAHVQAWLATLADKLESTLSDGDDDAAAPKHVEQTAARS